MCVPERAIHCVCARQTHNSRPVGCLSVAVAIQCLARWLPYNVDRERGKERETKGNMQRDRGKLVKEERGKERETERKRQRTGRGQELRETLSSISVCLMGACLCVRAPVSLCVCERQAQYSDTLRWPCGLAVTIDVQRFARLFFCNGDQKGEKKSEKSERGRLTEREGEKEREAERDRQREHQSRRQGETLNFLSVCLMSVCRCVR